MISDSAGDKDQRLDLAIRHAVIHHVHGLLRAAAEVIKLEMGEEARGVEYNVVIVREGEIGRLDVTGPPIAVAEFKRQVAERLGE